MARRMLHYWFGLCLLLVCFGFTADVAGAQGSGTGSIQGRVTDPSGAVVPGAKITIRNEGTNVSRTVESDAEGNYRVNLLPSGKYEVIVEAQGFATTKAGGVEVSVGGVATANLAIKVKTAESVVTVSDVVSTTDPEKVEVSNTVTQKQIEDLPINGRRWDNFVLLTPGVSPDGTFGLISSRGISGLLNNNTVDGADNNQAFFSETRGRTRVAYTISQSSIKEFQVGLSTFSAEFGRAAGGTVNAVTKSGTNDWHGEGFYYIRDDSLQAREPTLFDPAGNALKNKDRRQQYGLGLGGPIAKDKLFFYGNFDQQLRTESYLVSASGGTFFSTFNTSCVGTSTNAQLIANCAALQQFFIDIAGQEPRKRRNNVALGKVDWNISPNHTFTGSYNWHRWISPSGIQTQQTLGRAASDNGTDGVKTDVFIARLSSVLSSRLVNQASFQFGRDFEFQSPNSLDPRTTITNGISFGMSEFLPRPAWPDERRFQWTDTVSWTTGRHTIKAGLDINHVRDTTTNIRNGGGVFAYTTLQALAQDCPPSIRPACTPFNLSGTLGKHWNSYTQAFDLRVGATPGDIFIATTDYNFFVQDTFKWTPRLTVNAGLRYEYQTMPEVPSLQVNIPGIGVITAQGYPGQSFSPETTRLNKDKNNFGPRLAFAWDVGGNQKDVVRFGGGVYYGRTPNALIRSALLENGVALPSFSFSGTTPAQLAAGPVYASIFSSLPAGGSAGTRSVAFVANDYVNPFISMMDVAYERELSRNLAFSVTYLFTRGTHLTHASDINLNAPTRTVDFLIDADGSTTTTTDRTLLGTTQFYSGNRPLCDTLVNAQSATCATRLRQVIRQTSDLNSTYNAVIFQITQRQRWGLTQTAHLTISSAKDDGQAMGASPFAGSFESFFDPFNRFREYARSDFDVRKRFVWTFIWQPDDVFHPGNGARGKVFGGWSFNGIVTANDGQPVSLTVSGSISSTVSPSDTGSINGSNGSLRAGWLPRNNLETTAFASVDFRVQKEIKISERMSVKLLWEAFNLFNRSNHSNRFNFSTTGYRVLATTGTSSAPQVVLRQDTNFAGIVDPATGQGDLSLCKKSNCLSSASGVLFGARDMQLGVKFIF